MIYSMVIGQGPYPLPTYPKPADPTLPYPALVPNPGADANLVKWVQAQQAGSAGWGGACVENVVYTMARGAATP